MSDLVRREDLEGGIAVLSLNRPEALNALSPALFADLRLHVDAIAAQAETVGCVILRGEGRAFSAGNDLKAVERGEKAPSRLFQTETIDALENLPQPVIGSARGYCYTGGLELIIACDLIVCSETAKFADTHGKWALVPTWGMSKRLPRLVGELRAKEMSLTGRIIEGPEAVAWGLANRCVPDAGLEDATLELARTIVGLSWHSARGNKWLYNEARNHGYRDGLLFERTQGPGRGNDFANLVVNFGSGRKS